MSIQYISYQTKKNLTSSSILTMSKYDKKKCVSVIDILKYKLKNLNNVYYLLY